MRKSMKKMNCWEFKQCGREQGGLKSRELGVCPAAIADKADGINRGEKGGRACWAISGTLCGGKVQGTLATKIGNCMACDFYQSVQKEETSDFKTSGFILQKLRE